MVVKLPLTVRLTTDAEADALRERVRAVDYKPAAGFLLDTPLTKLPERAYRPRPCRKFNKVNRTR